MIVTLLKGGLGNQMFQYAAGRQLALKHAVQLAMDLSWFDNIAGVDSPRHYELGCFKLKQEFVKHSSLQLLRSEPTIKTSIKGLFKTRLNYYSEKSAAFDKEVLNLPDNTYLDGFWQNENYFKDIRSTILKDFAIATLPNSKNRATIDEIRSGTSVSLHVRRGDYAANKETNEFHGLMGLDYYRKAIEVLGKKTKSPRFFVFSDDPKWCKQNLKIGFETTYIDHNKDGFEDLRLMQHCDHHIIANSSFSWWGAWLNPKQDKIVIAPKVWFKDKKANSEMENIPKEWIRL